MGATKVFFSGLGPGAFRKLLEKSGILTGLAGKVAVKLHMGETYSKYVISPDHVAVALAALKEAGAEPFLTDTTALYRGTRSSEKDYLKTAAKNGYAGLGAPIVIADGDGDLQFEVPGRKYLKAVHIAKRMAEADSMLVLTHCKGHICAGFGGAIKNLAMGCTSKAGKAAMHKFPFPQFSREKCTGCGECAKSCPVRAIAAPDGSGGKAALRESACITCGACLRICRFGAVSFPDGDPAVGLQKRLADAALAVAKSLDGRIGYVNFLNNITKYCDCGRPSEIVAPDVGILASLDPVAIDAASHSLVGAALEKATGIDGSVQIKAAEELGLGSSKSYDLVRL